MTEERKKAEGIVRHHTFLSMGAGVIPIPLADITAVMALQMDMIKQLSEVYQLDYSALSGKSFITSLTGTIAARMGVSLIKLIPGVGSVIGALSMSVMSAASSYAIGKVCIQYFEKHINLNHIDPKTAKRLFEEEFKNGKKVVKDMEKEEKEPLSPAEDLSLEQPKIEVEEVDVFAKLVELGELRNENIITEEEFEEQKKALMDKL